MAYDEDWFSETLLLLGMDGLGLAVYLIGKYCIAVVMTSVYVYTAELYPTKYRHNLFAFSSMVGRIGSITAPLTPALVTNIRIFLLLGTCRLSL